MTEKLNPCPECGAEASIVEPVEGIFMAYCTKCGLCYKTFTNKEAAISDWNERTIEAQLEPCPFCDNPANIIGGSKLSNNYWYVVCSRCLARTRNVNSPDEAIRLWNMRRGDK